MTRAEIQPLMVLALVVLVLVIRVRTGHPPRWLRSLQQRRAGRTATRRAPYAHLVGPVVNVIVVGGAPWLLYLVIRPHVGSDATALAVATAVPVLWAVARWIRRRRFDLVGALVIGAYAVALAVSLALGDAAAPLKLRDVGILALVGMACVGSAVIRRPVLLLVVRYLSRQRTQSTGEPTPLLSSPSRQRDLAVATVLAGSVFLAAALIEVYLMFAVSTATFLAIAGFGGLVPLAAIALVILFLRHRSQQHKTEA